MRCLILAASAALAMLTGCASLTASEVSHAAMSKCWATRELSIDTTLTTTTTRVVCEAPR